ncbi:MAG TPA: ammonium transporter, partial [Anaerolineae bacterium]|nr:ammonium transporter [Anaerolineae bacterium]
METASPFAWLLLTGSLAFLVPTSLTLIAVGASTERRALHVALTGLTALAMGVILYALVGFGLQFGGLGLVSQLEGVEELVREWSPLDVTRGPGWGMAGLDGFLILGRDYNSGIYALFFFQAALAATATVIPALALAGRVRRPLLLLVILLVSAVIYPLFGNWAWGGGWLAMLGQTEGLAHGFVDFAGAGVVHGLGGMVALAGLLACGLRMRREELAEPATLPPVHFPLLAVLSSFLLLIGWFALAAGQPLTTPDVPPPLLLVNLLVAGSAGALLAALYTWFTTGSPELQMAVRGLVAGLVAASAPLPFVPPWAAAVIGAVAGLLVPLSTFVVERVLRLADATGAVSVHGVSGLWGLLALGLFADGRH